MANYSKLSVTSELSAVGSLNASVEAPDSQVIQEINIDNYIHTSELDYLFSYTRRKTNIRKFSLTWNGLTNTQKDTLFTFYTTKGIITPFNWTLPEETTAIKIKFSGPMVFNLIDAGVWNAEVSAEELEN